MFKVARIETVSVYSLFVTLSIYTHTIWGETNITYKHIIEPVCLVTE